MDPFHSRNPFDTIDNPNHHQPTLILNHQTNNHHEPINEHSLSGFDDDFFGLPDEVIHHHPIYESNDNIDYLELFARAIQRGDNKITQTTREFVNTFKRKEIEKIIMCLDSNPVHLCYVEFNIIMSTLDQYCQGAIDYFIDRQAISFIYLDEQKTPMPFEVTHLEKN